MHTIAILGPRSKAGNRLVSELLSAGFRVRTMIHGAPEFPITHPGLEVLRGDATHEADLKALLSGATVLVNSLGRPINQIPFYSAVTGLILRLAPEAGIQRLFTVTNAALRLPGDQPGFVPSAMAWMMGSLFRDFMVDRQAEYRLLAASGLDWTLIRLPVLLQGESNRPFRASPDRLSGFSVHTGQVPRFIIQSLKEDSWHHEAPFLAG